MKRIVAMTAGLFLTAVCTPFLQSSTGEEAPLFGFSAESSRAERKWEGKFKTIPKQENLREYMRRLTARPHNVGSAYDKENAEWIAAKFKEFGLETQIENFDVLYPTPKERLIELVEGAPYFKAKMQEPALPEDPTSNQQNEQLPTYNAHSIDGDGTGQLVYVNDGVPEDYEELERRGGCGEGGVVGAAE